MIVPKRVITYLSQKKGPLLINIHKYNLPSTIFRKFACANDLALLHSSENRKNLKRTLSQDMTTLLPYLQTWRLKLSHTQMVTVAFPVNNQEAKRELNIRNRNRLSPFCPISSCLGVEVDRFCHHLVALCKNYLCVSLC